MMLYTTEALPIILTFKNLSFLYLVLFVPFVANYFSWLFFKNIMLFREREFFQSGALLRVRGPL